MACMEHVCEECGYTYFDNTRYGCCPKCGGDTRDYCDEEPEED